MRIPILSYFLMAIQLGFSLGLSFADAQTRNGDNLALTVEKSIEIGLKNSKSLHASSMKVEAADAKESQVRTSRLPSLKFNGSYTRLSSIPDAVVAVPIPGVQPFTISQTILDNYSTKLTLQQPVFTGFKIESGINAAEYNTRASEQDYAKDKSDLIYNIRIAYWNLFKARELKKVVDENVEQVSAHLDDVKNLLNHGMATTNDMLRVQVQLSNTQLLQIDAKNNIQLAVIALNNVMALPLNTQVEIASSPIVQLDSSGVPITPTRNLDELVGKAKENRPEVKAMNFRVKASEAGVTAARSGWFPQIFLVWDYNYARPNSRLFPSVDRFKDTWDVSVVATWDIWNWGLTAHQTNEAQSQLAQARDVSDQLRDGVTLEVTQNYLNLQQAAERIGVSSQVVQQAQENHRVTDDKFKSGLALNTDLLDAEVSLLQAKTNYTQSLVDYELALARLDRAIGE